MMSEINKLRMELRTDLELMEVRGEQMAKAMDKTHRQVERLNQQVAAVAQDVHWFKGRYRGLGDRFDKILEAVTHDQQDLAARVSRLEQERTG